MKVRCCKECPFFQELPLLGTIGLLLAATTPPGVCGYDAGADAVVVVELGMKPGPDRDAMLRRAKRRMVVSDRTIIPSGCPLRISDVVVSLSLALDNGGGPDA